MTTANDPRAQLAQAMAGMTDEQMLGLLRAVGIDVVLQTVFVEIQRRFRPERTDGREVVVEWGLEAPEGGLTYQMTVAGPMLSWREGSPVPPVLLVSCTVTDFLRLMTGQLDSTEAFMTGKLRLSGDLELVQQMGEWFDLGETPVA